ncbi:MAG TPA: EamA family transporter [Candidatus Saccharimonadales bacterium]|nr:EamA family transporter [Candidatus Saccharimonadales bacterium]
MPLILLIALATVFYTLYDAFASKAGGTIDPNASSVIFNGLGAVIPLGIYLYIKLKGTGAQPITKNGVIYSLLAGVAIALFSIIFIKIFEKGTLSYVIPLIYGGTVVLASLLGIFMFHDKVSVLQVLGLFVIAVGISIVVIAKA